METLNHFIVTQPGSLIITYLSQSCRYDQLTILAESQSIPIVDPHHNLHKLKREVDDNKAKGRIKQEIYQVPKRTTKCYLLTYY